MQRQRKALMRPRVMSRAIGENSLLPLMVRPMATAKGVGLRCEFLTLPEAVVGDPLRLKQVLLNLLANAIKFSSQGFVTLRCRGSLGADGGAVLCVEVQDEGVGVPAEA